MAVYYHWSAIPLRDPPRARALSRCGIGSSRRTKRPWVGHVARKARASHPVQTTATTATVARRRLCQNRARARRAHRPSSALPVGSRGQRQGHRGHLAQLVVPPGAQPRRSLHLPRQFRKQKLGIDSDLQRCRTRPGSNFARNCVFGCIEARGATAAWAKAATKPQPAARNARATAVRMTRAASACL